MKAFICNLSSGAQYVDVNGNTKFAWKDRPITDADESVMITVSKDEKGNDVKVVKYGFEVFKGSLPGGAPTAAETAKEMKRLAMENEKLKAEVDEIKAKSTKKD